MTFQVIHSKDGSNAQSPFRVVEQPIGREVEWINRFLDRERVRCLAETTLRSYAMDLLHFLRWWVSVNHTDAVSESVLSATVLLDYLRFQAGQQPKPAAATINRRVGVVECAFFVDAPGPLGGAGVLSSGHHHTAVACFRHGRQPRWWQLGGGGVPGGEEDPAAGTGFVGLAGR